MSESVERGSTRRGIICNDDVNGRLRSGYSQRAFGSPTSECEVTDDAPSRSPREHECIAHIGHADRYPVRQHDAYYAAGYRATLRPSPTPAPDVSPSNAVLPRRFTVARAQPLTRYFPTQLEYQTHRRNAPIPTKRPIHATPLQRQQTIPPQQTMRRLRSAHDLAQKVGTQLGRCQILLRRMPEKARCKE